MPKTAPRELTERSRQRRYRKAAALIRKWMSEDPEYDECVGKALEQERFPVTIGRDEEPDS